MTVLGQLILHLYSRTAGVMFREVPGRGEIRCRVPCCPLPAGEYGVSLWAESGGEPLDWVDRSSDTLGAPGQFPRERAASTCESSGGARLHHASGPSQQCLRTSGRLRAWAGNRRLPPRSVTSVGHPASHSRPRGLRSSPPALRWSKASQVPHSNRSACSARALKPRSGIQAHSRDGRKTKKWCQGFSGTRKLRLTRQPAPEKVARIRSSGHPSIPISYSCSDKGSSLQGP